jgi:hypothetical protein
MSAAGVVLVILVIAVVVLGTAAAFAVMSTRRYAGTATPGVDAAQSFGRELFERSLRLDRVAGQAKEAERVAAVSGTYMHAEIASVAARLLDDCATTQHKLRTVAPLTGAARAHALSLIDPLVTAYERAGSDLVSLATSAAAAAQTADTAPADDVARRVGALRGALDELESGDAIQARISAMLEGQPPDALPPPTP